MNENLQKEQAKAIADIAYAALDNKKGIDVTTLAVGEQTILADYFVLATGTANTHVRALADEVIRLFGLRWLSVREGTNATSRDLR